MPLHIASAKHTFGISWDPSGSSHPLAFNGLEEAVQPRQPKMALSPSHPAAVFGRPSGHFIDLLSGQVCRFALVVEAFHWDLQLAATLVVLVGACFCHKGPQRSLIGDRFAEGFIWRSYLAPVSISSSSTAQRPTAL